MSRHRHRGEYWSVNGKLIWGNVPISPTSFGLFPIEDRFISDEKLVPLVFNIEDPKNLEKSETEDIGKKRGVGLIGGGLSAEDYDIDPQKALEREVEAETGLRVSEAREIFNLPHIIVSDRRTGERLYHHFYDENGPLPEIRIDPRRIKKTVALKNPIHIFSGKLQWAGTNLQRIFHEQINKLVESGNTTREEIAQYGFFILFEDLTEDERNSLKIDELDEIYGIGLFTISLLAFMKRGGEKHLFGHYFYPSHLDRIFRGLYEMSLFEYPTNVAESVAQ